jgi:hypothetical protein
MDPARARGGPESELGKNVFWGALHISLIINQVEALTISFDGDG